MQYLSAVCRIGGERFSSHAKKTSMKLTNTPLAYSMSLSAMSPRMRHTYIHATSVALAIKSFYVVRKRGTGIVVVAVQANL